MLLPYQDALDRLLAAVPPPQAALVSLREASGKVLAEDVRADHDVPPFDKSCMDGYALRAADLDRLPRRLQVVGTRAAGRLEDQLRVGPGQAVQIMTGAPLAEGADAVQMVEKTRSVSEHEVEIEEGLSPGLNVASQGSEVSKGEVVLKAGRLIRPAEIAVLAAFGISRPKVFRTPRVAIFTTGDELVDVEASLQPGQIRNSNAWMLAAQCARLGLRAEVQEVVPDAPEAVEKALTRALEYDAALFSGGVSAGEFDFVHKVLGEAGVEVLFHKVAIKPGKPFLAAVAPEGKMILGLPGNPVSAFVTFEVLARPALGRWMGLSVPHLLSVTGRLAGEVRQRPGRLFFKPAHTRWSGSEWIIEPIETRGSADITGFSPADSLLLVPAECDVIAAQSQAEAWLLPGYADSRGTP
ncbi:MAG TPA: gephyrin-like molybdotransferase Glp [Acidobacteriota bacterium]|nr:gephyrin-like molybdotransferase Glp [Acidobacteriota bacterium]